MVVLQLTIVASPFPTHPVQCFVCIHCLSKFAFAAALGRMHKEPATERREVWPWPLGHWRCQHASWRDSLVRFCQKIIGGLAAAGPVFL